MAVAYSEFSYSEMRINPVSQNFENLAKTPTPPPSEDLPMPDAPDIITLDGENQRYQPQGLLDFKYNFTTSPRPTRRPRCIHHPRTPTYTCYGCRYARRRTFNRPLRR